VNDESPLIALCVCFENNPIKKIGNATVVMALHDACSIGEKSGKEDHSLLRCNWLACFTCREKSIPFMRETRRELPTDEKPKTNITIQ
jgi:hypothetical protein